MLLTAITLKTPGGAGINSCEGDVTTLDAPRCETGPADASTNATINITNQKLHRMAILSRVLVKSYPECPGRQDERSCTTWGIGFRADRATAARFPIPGLNSSEPVWQIPAYREKLIK